MPQLHTVFFPVIAELARTRLNTTHLILPVCMPVKNLCLASTAQIYPTLTNGESIIRHAHRAAQIILDGSLASASSSARIAR